MAALGASATAAAPPLDDLSVEAEAPNLLARGAGLLRRHGVCHLRGAFGPALAAGGGGGLAARAARILADVQRRLVPAEKRPVVEQGVAQRQGTDPAHRQRLTRVDP